MKKIALNHPLPLLLLAAATALAVLAAARPVSEASLTAARLAELPPRMLWAWERPEDLRFIDVHQIGVAYFAATIDIADGTFSFTPRRNPLRVPAGAKLVPVAHVEVGPAAKMHLEPHLRRRLVAAILTVIRPDTQALQLDFEAPLSARGLYRDLIVELRAAMPADLPLSITALASWCMHDAWLADLPVDEIVPMLFRMGADGPYIRSRLADGAHAIRRECRGSAGIATDEPLPVLPRKYRIYAFNPHAWSASSVIPAAAEILP